MTDPYRSPHPYFVPMVIDNHAPLTVQVSIPNEDPENEDDLTIQVVLSNEGIIVDYFASDGPPAATFGQTYEEFIGTIHALDPINKNVLPVDSSRSKVAALSADLRLLVESDDDYVDDAQTMMCATDLLDAIDALLAEPNGPQQFHTPLWVRRPELEERISFDGYHPEMLMYCLTDAAQGDEVIAYVPESQVASLLAHLNGGGW
jgi:hypothetical protein